MLVTQIIGNCPGCGAENKYGGVSVKIDHVLLGCQSCQYTEAISLPPIKKKIIYLDQFFLSNAFKGYDPQFQEAAQLITQSVERQLLVAPFSSTHKDETQLWRGHRGKNREALMDFIKTACHGHEFYSKYHIEQAQVLTAFSSFLNRRSPYYTPSESEALRSEVHQWENYFWVDAGSYIKNIDLIRKLKTDVTNGLLDAFDSWRTSPTTFEEDLAIEFRAAANIYIQAYLKRIECLAKGDLSALLDTPAISTIIDNLLSSCPADIPPDKRHYKIIDFLYSQHFQNIPYQSISCHFFAVLKDKVKRGAYTNREKAERKLRGLAHDIEHVAAHAPYCDAFIMDNFMAEIMTSSTLNLEKIYNVKVFCLNNWPELLSWLQDLNTNISSSHRIALKSAYGTIF